MLSHFHGREPGKGHVRRFAAQFFPALIESAGKAGGLACTRTCFSACSIRLLPARVRQAPRFANAFKVLLGILTISNLSVGPELECDLGATMALI